MAIRNPIPVEWLPRVPMQRIHAHWTAGWYTPRPDELRHYHFIVDGEGRWHRGVSIAMNAAPLNRDLAYAAHTLNANEGAIGVSLACMVGAQERPFNPGRAPMTRLQWDSMIAGMAQLAEFYGIPVTFKTVLSHAEVGQNLNRPQRGKWDFTRVPFDLSLVGARAIGDRMRAEVAAAMAARVPVAAKVEETMNDPRAEAAGTVGGGAAGYAADEAGDAMLAAAAPAEPGFVSEMTGHLTVLAGYGLKAAGTLLMVLAAGFALYTAGKYALRLWRYHFPPKPNAAERERGL